MYSRANEVTFSSVGLTRYLSKLSRIIARSVFPAISMSRKSSSVRNRVRTIVLSDSTPAPPVFTSVPSMSKRRRRFAGTEKIFRRLRRCSQIKEESGNRESRKDEWVPDYFVDSLLPDLSSSRCAATQMTNDG